MTYLDKHRLMHNRQIKARISAVLSDGGAYALAFADTDVKLKLNAAQVEWLCYAFTDDDSEWAGKEIVITKDGDTLLLTRPLEASKMEKCQRDGLFDGV